MPAGGAEPFGHPLAVLSADLCRALLLRSLQLPPPTPVQSKTKSNAAVTHRRSSKEKDFEQKKYKPNKEAFGKTPVLTGNLLRCVVIQHLSAMSEKC